MSLISAFKAPRVSGLNPYSTGRYSMSKLLTLEKDGESDSLNPYSTGRYSMRQ